MPLFSETVAAAAAKRDIGASLLVWMDFKDAPRRWWVGFGTLRAGGYEWLGLGTLISVEGIEWQGGTAATEATFTLSKVDPEIEAIVRESEGQGVVTLAQRDSDRVADRKVVVYLQFFHTSATRSGLAEQVHSNLDRPVAIWAGKMAKPRFSGDLTTKTIVVPANNLWADRNKPAYGLYTDRSQKGRFPGDRGLEQAARLAHSSLNWPATK